MIVLQFDKTAKSQRRLHSEKGTKQLPQQQPSEGYNADPITCHRDSDEGSIPEVVSCPAEDTTNNSQAVIVTGDSSLFAEDELRSKEFIEKYTGVKSVFMKIPELSLLLQNNGEVVIESSPFTFKIDQGENGYRLKIIIPVRARFIAVALVIIQGDYDDVLPWPFPNVIAVFQLQDTDERVIIEEKGFQCRKEDSSLMKSLTKPQNRQNEPFGLLNFCSKDSLQDKLQNNSVLSMNCLIFPPFSSSFVGVDLKEPLVVPVKNNRKQHIHIPDVPVEARSPPCQAHTSDCKGEWFLPGQPELTASLGYPVRYNLPVPVTYGICESVKMHTGSTLVTMTISNVESLLRSGDTAKCLSEKTFKVPSATRHDLFYKVKLISKVTSDHLSLALVILKGESDHRLSWPFDMTVIIGLMNTDNKLNRERGFRCYGNGLNFSDSLGQPKANENLPIGITCFIPLQALKNGFIIRNSLNIKCLLLPRDFPLQVSMKEYPSVII